MNMSDDVSSAVVGMSTQVAQKGLEMGGKAVEKITENIAKLLKLLFQSGAALVKSVKSSNMTDIKSGTVDVRELVTNARKNNDSVVSTDGYSKADMKAINKKAKEYGIPVAFTNKKGKENISAHVRGSDKAIFEKICTEVLKDKIKERPQELDNFIADKWEIEGIQRELSKYDLNANWGKTKNDEYFCLFEKADKKAVLMARGEFIRKCNEVEKDLTIVKSEDGYFMLKDEISGKHITFDEIPSKNELAKMIEDKFGYDENKADIACRKFGENHLSGELKKEYFGNNPQNEFSKIDNHIELKGESILVKDYDCLRVTAKEDGISYLVYRDENNNFAMLNPDKMTRKEMSEVLRESLGIEDDKTIDALVDKAEKVNDYYVKQNVDNFRLSQEYPVVFVNEAGEETTQTLSSVTDIDRVGKDSFKVTSVSSGTISKELVLSFSDKKNAIAELQQLYENQGMNEYLARKTAKEVFAKAQAQSAEKVLHIEEIKVSENTTKDTVATFRYGNDTEDINVSDRKKAIEELEEKFGVFEKEAEILLDKTMEQIEDEIELENVEEIISENDKTINGHEKNPAESVDLKPEASKGAELPETGKGAELPGAGKGAELPDIELPKGRGRR